MNYHSSAAAICLTMAVTMATAGPLFAAPQKDSLAPPAEGSKEQQPAMLTGKVAETMNAGGYTYINLEKGGKKQWVAVPEMKVKVGQQISLRPGYVMPNFRSKALERTFDEIIFSGGLASDPGAAGGLPAGHAPIGEQGAGSKGAVSPLEKDVKVEKAAGADSYTVGEIYAKRSTLNKKTAMVKGKVVKVSTGIMGKNWVHLQDGTGDQKKNTHNLVVTTDEQPSVGDVITMKGTIAKDKDFGAGYKYEVILEKAAIQK